jgi:uncharacterized protein (DUF2336 family)
MFAGMAIALMQADVDRLVAESSASARADVADKLAREIDSASLTQSELRIANDILRIMAQDAEVTVRQALSHSMRWTRELPHDVALRLAHDVEPVALPILSSSPVLTDEDLVTLVNCGSSSKQEAIAGREEVSERVADALVVEGSETAVAALMGNPSARISHATLDVAIERFQPGEWVKTSVEHHQVPGSVVADIVGDRHGCVTPERRQASTESELERLVRQMHRDQRLTPILLLQALCLGDLAFFEMAMAVMARVPVVNARILIHDAGHRGLASLWEKAGMPPRLLPAVRAGLDAVRGTEWGSGEHDPERCHSRIITQLLTQFADLPRDDLDYLLDKLGNVVSVPDHTASPHAP